MSSQSQSPTPIKPDFNGGWNGNVITPLLTRDFPDWYPLLPKKAEQNVVLVADGFGWNLWLHWRTKTKLLEEFSGQAITTVSPSTTTAALSSITLGIPPGEHGIIGYRLRYNDTILVPLRWRLEDLSATVPVPVEFQPHPPFAGHSVPIVFNRRFANTNFTQSHIPGMPVHSFTKTKQIPEIIAGLLASEQPVVYLYLDIIDKTGHASGAYSGAMYRALQKFEVIVQTILNVMPSTACLSITADHGLIDISEDHILDFGNHDDWVEMIAGESRNRALWATPGNEANLLAFMKDLWGDRAWIVSRAELFEEKWLSPTLPTCPIERIPDVTLIPHDKIGFIDPNYLKETQLKARHGGATSAEMHVPFISAMGLNQRINLGAFSAASYLQTRYWSKNDNFGRSKKMDGRRS